MLQVGTDGVGTTQVVRPPAGGCVATLEIPKGGSKVRVLETLSFVAV